MTATLTFEKIKMSGADVGDENPLPDINGAGDIHAQIRFDETISEEESRFYNYGRISGILPYRMQDGYNRDKRIREYDGIVLENAYLRAVFFPQFGGKLWSLYDKIRKRDLVHVNPVFQPCNLALRNGWTSGGVEWNLGMTGHTPFTLSPLFTCVGELGDGTPVLRMYEWERIRQVSYEIDAFLPEDSKFLFVRVRLHNTREDEVPIYWWSNTAVDETPDTRVIAPADRAFSFDYDRVMKKIPVPRHGGLDKSYTTNIPYALDLFFDIPERQRKWEAALDEWGEGLIQTSTDLLRGRKLFLWGNGSGGKRWQEFLSEPGKAYLEIQAGLAHTQMEHLPMPGNACWEWLEAYGSMSVDPKRVHGENWDDARESIETQLQTLLPREKMDSLLKRLGGELSKAWTPIRVGSGWAALELEREGKVDFFSSEAVLFSRDTLGPEQQPWLSLLQTGKFPDQSADSEPAAYLTQAEWITILERSVREGKSNHWHAWLHLGVMYCAQGETDKARHAFTASNELFPNAWAKRNLARLALLDGNSGLAADLLSDAVGMMPILPLVLEYGRILLEGKRFAEFAELYRNLPHAVQEHNRVRAMRAHAAVYLDDFDLALSILQSDLQVSDIREGEILLSDIWTMLHMHKIACEEGIPEDDSLRRRVLLEFPIPEALDFRMRT